MKKLLALCVVLMIALTLPVLVSAEDEVPYVETTLFEANFDDVNTLSNKITGNGIVDADGNVLVTTHEFDDSEHNKVWRLGTTTYAADNLSTIPGTVIFEADVYFNSSYSSNRNFLLYDEQFIDVQGSSLIFRSKYKYLLGENDLTLKSSIVGQWIHLKMESNKTERTVKFYIDGELVGETFVIPSSFSRFATKLRFYNGQYGTHEVYVDNMKLYNRVENYTVSGEITEAYKSGSEIVLTFSEKMNADTLVAGGTVTLTNSYGAPVAFDGVYDADAKTYTITTTEDMLPKTAHTITLDGVKTANGGAATTATYEDGALLTNIATIDFTTGKPDFAITAVESTGANSYNVTVQDTEDTGVGYIVATSYTAGVLTDITLVPADAATTYTVTLTTGGDITEFALLSSDGNFTVLDIWGE